MQEPPLYQDKYRIPSTRLPGYDYGQSGMYFITICTQNCQPYFGRIEVTAGNWDSAFLRPTETGKYAVECWAKIPDFASFVQLDAFVLMPDHLHGILIFDKENADGADAETRSVASLKFLAERPLNAAVRHQPHQRHGHVDGPATHGFQKLAAIPTT